MKKLVIAGPCALESKEQIRASVKILKPLGVNTIRASLWKPRTQPGWEGMGALGLSILLEETLPYGMTPATEILNAEHALLIVHALESIGAQGKMLVWLGSRNQNHLEQKTIAKILATGPEGITLMFKNQMWDDEKHWLGIAEHILSQGFPSHRLLVCHRGFSPGKMDNPKALRNIPDFSMSMRVKEKTALPMLIDPSHIGGSKKNVLEICEEALKYDFDGFMIEMHIDPENAKTDAKQQLSPKEFQDLLELLNMVNI